MSVGRKSGGLSPAERTARGDAPGIVILDGGLGVRANREPPRIPAFVYGEKLPSVPTLPFGRWKTAS